MRLKLIAVFLFMTTVVAALPARQAGPAQLAYEAARSREVVDRDLPGAIALYRDVVSTFGSDRAVAAEALLRMAGCLEQLGKPEAQSIYDLIVKEYTTSPAATAARAKLAAWAQPAGAVISRPVAAFGFDNIAPDGSYTTFNGPGADLYLRDLTSGKERPLTTNWKEPTGHFPDDGNGNGAPPAISPDSHDIAYGWHPNYLHLDEPDELRVVSRDGGSPRIVYSSADNQAVVLPCGWTPDGKWILATVQQERALELVLIPGEGGTPRLVKRFGPEDARNFKVSPDGLWIAYDAQASLGKPERDLFSLSIDGSRGGPMRPNAADDYVLGWIPGSDRMLFASDRNGTYGIWSTQIVDGVAPGEPVLVRPGVGHVVAKGLTAKGDFYYTITHLQADVYLATLDPNTGRQTGQLVRLEGRFIDGMTAAAFSPDGDRIVYVQAMTPAATLQNPASLLGPLHMKLAIQTLSTGSLRLLSLALRNIENFAWLPDGHGLIVSGDDYADSVPRTGRQGLFFVDLATEVVTAIPDAAGSKNSRVIAGQPSTALAVSPDGRRVFFHASAPPGAAGGIVARDSVTGEEEALTPATPAGFSLSPNGEWLAVSPGQLGAGVRVRPSSGGPPQPLAAGLKDWVFGRAIAWSPDARFVYAAAYSPSSSDKHRVIWQIPVDGTEPRDTGISWTGPQAGITRISVDREGIRLALSTDLHTKQTWVLQNLLTARDKLGAK